MSSEVIFRPGLPSLPEDLLLARDQGRVLFVVGAGASYPKPTQLPDFGGLVAKIYDIVDPSMSSPIKAVSKKDGPKWGA